MIESNETLLERLLRAHQENLRLLHNGHHVGTPERKAARARVDRLQGEVLARMEEPDLTPEVRAGDLCRILGLGLVEHDETCAMYPAGTVTDVRTGEVVER